jgi:hypothetical protein
MKNLFIAVSLLLTAYISNAQPSRSKLYASTSPDINNPISLNREYKDAPVQDAKTNTETSTDNLASMSAYFNHKSAGNYLVGTWTVQDTTNRIPPMSLTFDDSMHVKLSMAKEGAAHLTYSVLIYHHQVVLHFEGRNSRNVKTHMNWFVKVLDNKTIEAEQSLYSPKTCKWNEAIAITVVKQS